MPRFKKAAEPTDIIWENRCISDRDRMIRTFKAYFIIFILLAGSFYATFRIARSSAQVAMVFPSRDCVSIDSAYGDQLSTFAVSDYNYVATNDFNGVVSQGPYQCFCQNMVDNDYDNLSVAGVDPQAADGTFICNKYKDLTYSVLFWVNALSYIIIGVNYGLREACIALVKYIGYPT